MKIVSLAALPLLILVSACGGEGSNGSSGSAPVAVIPAPTATPSPLPSPSPSATATPTPTETPTPRPLPSPTPIAADGNWSTFQGDAGHTGYVPARYSTANFADAWTITTAGSPSDVAARAGAVFYNVAPSDGRIYTRAVATATGALLWGFDLGQGSFGQGRRPYGPSYANNRVASIAYNTTSTAASFQVINATTGGYLTSLLYDAQFSDGSVPTPAGNELFFAAGYYGNVVYGADAAAGVNLWRSQDSAQYGGYVMQGESVAVDSHYVYYYKAGALVALFRDDGTLAKAIANPFFTRNGISYSGEYVGGPMLDGNGRVFVFADNYSRGQSLPIAAFSLSSERPLWRTSYSYTGQPAVRGDRLYAVRSSSTVVDIVDTSTGLVSASIDVGGNGNLTSNVVVTDTHLFVASASTTFAVDLTRSDHRVVWRTEHGGSLAITPDGYLIVSMSGGLHAAKLN